MVHMWLGALKAATRRRSAVPGDVNDANELKEIYTLLTENYVEDDAPWPFESPWASL